MPFYSIRPDRERPGGWQILSLAGVPFYVEPSFLIFIGLILISQIQAGLDLPGAGLLGFVIFFSLLVHEAGHALTARLLGYRDISVSLVMFGGQTSHPGASRGHGLLIVLAGPLATVGIVILVWLAPRLIPGLTLAPGGPGAYVLYLFFTLNLFWAALNLLPIYPMDGGQALLGFLSYVLSYPRALQTVAVISLLLCAPIVPWALWTRQIFVVLLALLFISQNVQILRMMRKN